ncbi:uncharacterized protein N7506_003826 [Penicillium brevicompactum]|uniref:uncharacterized protein n=1 Tax=Penicillium brevicompactum TaxID=5074 RepID=UPI00254015E1|nr:uncharacterized protein N7506_003826 [Penicillium brevicompactum]KAJ5344002.1 hypothetical protein N7506_003826 [Penicillium brevicompactum]
MFFSVDARIDHAHWNTADTLNAYPVPANATVKTHPGWNDNITTWISLPVDNWNGRFIGMGGGG